MGAYNLWGKRCYFPPLTDAIQGCAWGSLAIYAPLALGEAPGVLAWTVAVYVAVFTLLFNGVHGSLRDLANDFSTGARTTAIVLGARRAPDADDAYVPRALAVFASVVLAALIATSTALVLRNDFGYCADRLGDHRDSPSAHSISSPWCCSPRSCVHADCPGTARGGCNSTC